MDQQQLNELIDKYLDGTASKEEQAMLLQWYRDTGYQDAQFPESEIEAYKDSRARLHAVTRPSCRGRSYRRWAVAASLIIIAAAATLIPLKRKLYNPAIAGPVTSPGANKAILTLGNGSVISLSDAGNGPIASQNGVRISKTANGQLLYHFDTAPTPSASETSNPTIVYNSIETPVGSQYQVVLPDGSKVWLNAVSSIRFPVSMSSDGPRTVELKGEAYFEVKHNSLRPFRVLSGGQSVEDLGTEFNIHAYADEPTIRTTLVSGLAKVSAGGTEKLLQPGEQAGFNNSITVSKPNIENVIAWRNGYFVFENDNLEDVMKAIGRWYNIRCVFEDQSLRHERYGVITARFPDLSSLLNMMEQIGKAHFSMQGATVSISRKTVN